MVDWAIKPNFILLLESWAQRTKLPVVWWSMGVETVSGPDPKIKDSKECLFCTCISYNPQWKDRPFTGPPDHNI